MVLDERSRGLNEPAGARAAHSELWGSWGFLSAQPFSAALEVPSPEQRRTAEEPRGALWRAPLLMPPHPSFHTELQDKAAVMLGVQQTQFVPTNTMANLMAGELNNSLGSPCPVPHLPTALRAVTFTDISGHGAS